MTIFNRIRQQKTEITVLLIFVYELCFPHFAVAAELPKPDSIMLPSYVLASSTEMVTEQTSEETLTEAPTVKIIKTYTVPITAYSSTADQTDSTPCHTANGYDLCKNNQENVIAANFLPLGTKVRIPQYFGDRVFTVQDRMNARYYYRADVWFKTRVDAMKFGIRTLKIEVIE
ncbi:MAG: hypothetical protein WCX71_03605 [Candidatus Buchananbacteria bacterium]